MERNEIIQQSLRGQLSEQDEMRLQEELLKDMELQAEYNEARDMYIAFQQDEREQLKSLLQSREAITQNETPVRSINTTPASGKSWLPWLAAAAAITVLLLSFPIWGSSSDDPEALFVAHFEPYPNTLQPIVRGDETTVHPAFQAYEAGDYETAQQEFYGLLDMLEDTNMRFYLGISQMELEDYTRAEHNLLQAIKSQNYSAQAEYYLGLLYLKTGKPEKTMQLFATLQNEHPQVMPKQIEAILQELD